MADETNTNDSGLPSWFTDIINLAGTFTIDGGTF
jgi:hypothetical protein